MAASAVWSRSDRIGVDLCHVHNGSEIRFKRRRQKTVTWPIDQKICEVRLFLIDDAPSSLGAAAQEHLQCKQANALSYNEAHHFSKFNVSGATKRARLELDVPPGFGHTSIAAKSCHLNSQLDAVMAVTRPWHGPPKLLLDGSWLWAGGEESLEVASQQQRERRFFEAFYPRLASIPDSPLEPSQEPSKEIDDGLVAEIPLIPLEEELEIEDTEQDSISTVGGAVLCVSEEAAMSSNGGLFSVPMKQQQESTISLADSNIAAAAAAACMVVKALGESDLVDEKLLLEILKNPSLLKSLTCSSNNIMKNQDNSGRQVSHQEPWNHKLPSDYGACLNRSPVSVLTQWGDGVSTSNPSRMTPISNGSTHMQQSTNSSRMSMNPHPATNLPTPYLSNSELSRGLVQQGAHCTPRLHQQKPEIRQMDTCSRATKIEAFSTHVYGPRDSSINGSIKDSYTCSMQAVMTTSSLLSVHPTPLPTKDLSQRNLMQVGPSKCRSAEDSALPRRTSALSLSPKTRGRILRLCRYFNSPRGCRNGETCAFAHQSLDPGASTMAQ